jgi:hypothetical protein
MPCYHPLKVWNLGEREGGKKTISFKNPQDDSEELKIPCGHCIGCKKEKARQWAVRASHEASLYDDNAFITLTYNNEHLPQGQNCDECAKNSLEVFKACEGKYNYYTICQRDVTLFLKRLRDKLGKFRYFGCTEYGDDGERPHAHILLFGLDFKDKQVLTRDKNTGGAKYFISETLTDIWGKGYTLIAPVVYETAQYVAGYVYKKVGKKYQQYANRIFNYIDYQTGEYRIIYLKPYDRINPITGNVYTVGDEKQFMSRRPGIARKWLEQNVGDLLHDGTIHINGQRHGSTKYYDRFMEKEYPKRFKELKAQRAAYAEEHQEEYTRERLAQKELCQKRRMEDHTRNLELKKLN